MQVNAMFTIIIYNVGILLSTTAYKNAAIRLSYKAEDAGTHTSFFCSLSITGLILQHMKAKLPPGIISTNGKQ